MGNIKIARATRIAGYDATPVTRAAILADIDDVLLERLTAAEIAILMRNICRVYHRGRAAGQADIAASREPIMLGDRAIWVEDIAAEIIAPATYA